MSRYSDMDYFMNLDIYDGLEIIDEAIEQRRRSQHWDLYVSKYPNMDKKTYVPFEDFYKRTDGNKIKNNKENQLQNQMNRKEYAIEAIALAEKIKKAHQEGSIEKVEKSPI